MSNFLSEFITDQDKEFDVTTTTAPKKYKRGTLSDIATGAVSGTAKGVNRTGFVGDFFI